jgi:hypothetical protein
MLLFFLNICAIAGFPHLSNVLKLRSGCSSFLQDRKCMYNVTLRRFRVIIFAVETLTYSECVSVALVIQHAMRMCRIIFSSVACMTLPHFSTSSLTRHDFPKNVLFVLIAFTNSVWNISRFKKKRATIDHKSTTYMGFHVQYRYSCHVSVKAAFPDRFPKNTQISKSTQGKPSCSMQKDGHIYMTHLTVAFRFFCERALKVFHFNFNEFH